MTFTLTSESFRDGDYLAPEHLLSESFGFGGSGGNVSPALSWTAARTYLSPRTAPPRHLPQRPAWPRSACSTRTSAPTPRWPTAACW